MRMPEFAQILIAQRLLRGFDEDALMGKVIQTTADGSQEDLQAG